MALRKGSAPFLLPLQGTVHAQTLQLCPPQATPLTRSRTPRAVRAVPENTPENTRGLRSIMFAVEDIDATVAVLRAHGPELVGAVARHPDRCRRCCVRGPEGIVVALAEQPG